MFVNNNNFKFLIKKEIKKEDLWFYYLGGFYWIDMVDVFFLIFVVV